MNYSYPSTSAVVLAGGLSRRMGQDKRRLRLHGGTGPTLLEHTVALVSQVCAEVVVVLNDAEHWPALNARTVPDVYPDGGALGGIYAGLQAASFSHALLVACDMPFLNRDLLRAMLAHPRTYDALVPRSPHGGATRNALAAEPLHAIYSKACLEPMRAALDQQRRQIAAFFSQVRVVYLEPEAIRRYDPHGRSFANVNTPEDLAKLEDGR